MPPAFYPQNQITADVRTCTCTYRYWQLYAPLYPDTSVPIIYLNNPLVAFYVASYLARFLHLVFKIGLNPKRPLPVVANENHWASAYATLPVRTLFRVVTAKTTLFNLAITDDFCTPLKFPLYDGHYSQETIIHFYLKFLYVSSDELLFWVIIFTRIMLGYNWCVFDKNIPIIRFWDPYKPHIRVNTYRSYNQRTVMWAKSFIWLTWHRAVQLNKIKGFKSIHFVLLPSNSHVYNDSKSQKSVSYIDEPVYIIICTLFSLTQYIAFLCDNIIIRNICYFILIICSC